VTAPLGQGVRTERRGDAWWVTLDRPDRANAFDEPMRRAIIAALDEGAASGAAATVLTGAGRSFCAGGLLEDIASATHPEIRALYFGSLELFEAIRNHPLPVVAAVNGPAVGGGVELVGACDLAVAAEHAWFSMNSVRVGSAPVLGGTGVLALAMGEKHAREAMMLGGRHTAADAMARGWVNRVVPRDDLEAEVGSIVVELAKASPRSLEIAKMSANVWWNMSRHSMVAGLEALVRSFSSGDLHEGAQALLERREPQFRMAAT
jgi:enoyl-CoA hydratase/carnithine racemase